MAGVSDNFGQRERVCGVMMEGPPSNLRVRLRPLYWPAALITILIVRAAVSFAAKPGSPLLSYGGISYFLLLLLATGFAIAMQFKNTLGSRIFWVFLATGYSLWALDQSIFIYHEFVLHTSVPESIADPVLFFHIVPFMAAVATRPTPHGSGPGLYRSLSNFLLLLFFWGFLYVYAVFPYQHLFSNTTPYALRFDILYLIENLALIAATGIVSLRVQYPWKLIYLHLLGASALYARALRLPTQRLTLEGMSTEDLWLGPHCIRLLVCLGPGTHQQITKPEARATRFDTGQAAPASEWSMLVVLLIRCAGLGSVPKRFNGGHAYVPRTRGDRRDRVSGWYCLYKGGFRQEELISQLGLANERLRLALEAASVAWKWKVED